MGGEGYSTVCCILNRWDTKQQSYMCRIVLVAICGDRGSGLTCGQWISLFYTTYIYLLFTCNLNIVDICVKWHDITTKWCSVDIFAYTWSFSV